jgi:hypothetical protein
LMTKYVLNVPHVKILIIVVGVCSWGIWKNEFIFIFF